ncbi:NAD-P-binding protein [Peniophora sp. CONT]|nr:NAD-P-binding protein [Peniophora sp. CONT]
MSVTWLVTGANRGIGLALVKQLVQDSSNVILAACRSPEKADDLKALGNSVHVFKLDVGDPESISASVEPARAILGDKGLDYLVNNAGIAEKNENAFKFDHASALHVLQVNVLGPALVSQTYLPFLEVPGRRGVIMNISSSLGAFSVGKISGLAPSYSMSKAALNMLGAKQAVEKPNLIPFTVCPGWVQTDMGGAEAAIKPEDSAAALVKLAKSVTKEHVGKFLQRDGTSTGY